MVYYKLEDVSIITDVILVTSHKNFKSLLKVPYKHHSNKCCK